MRNLGLQSFGNVSEQCVNLWSRHNKPNPGITSHQWGILAWCFPCLGIVTFWELCYKEWQLNNHFPQALPFPAVFPGFWHIPVAQHLPASRSCQWVYPTAPSGKLLSRGLSAGEAQRNWDVRRLSDWHKITRGTHYSCGIQRFPEGSTCRRAMEGCSSRGIQFQESGIW